MTAVDTSREAVEAMAGQLEPIGDGDVCQHCREYRFPALPDAAALLRALLAERDEARASLTTARADALKEAAIIARDAKAGDPEWVGDKTCEYVATEIERRALIEKEFPHD